MPTIPAKINVGPDGPTTYLQAGRKYGVNDSGPFQSFSRRGTQAEIEAIAPSFNVAGWTYVVTIEECGLATIEAAAGFHGSEYSGETPENIWELDPNETEKNLTEADFPFASTFTGGVSAAITKANKDRIQDAIKRPEDFIDQSPAFSSGGGDAAAANSLYLLMKEGVQSFPVEASTIVHTQLVSNRYTVQASYNNCNRIIRTASMASVEGVPTDLLYSLPNEPTVTQFIEAAGDLQYGWRKLRPRISRLSAFKWRIAQSYQFGLWALRLYGARL